MLKKLIAAFAAVGISTSSAFAGCSVKGYDWDKELDAPFFHFRQVHAYQNVEFTGIFCKKWRASIAVNEFIRKGESHDDAIDHANSLHGKEVCRFTTKIVAPQCAALRGDTNTRPVAIGEVIDNEGRVYYVGHYPSREDLRQPARDRW